MGGSGRSAPSAVQPDSALPGTRPARSASCSPSANPAPPAPSEPPAASCRSGSPAPPTEASPPAAPSPPTGARALPLRSLPPSTVTKLGQKPSRQEKSLLQDDWSMARLLPNSVSIGVTERQLEATEQSPQPSQTAWLMNTRLLGSG